MSRRLVILGTGGHACIVIDAARSIGFDILGCIGPEPPVFSALHCPHLGDDAVLDSLDRGDCSIAIGVGSVGDASLRTRLFYTVRAAGFRLEPIIHPRAVVASTATLGPGAQVLAMATVNPFAVLGSNVIVNTGAIVEHHVVVADHTHLSPGAIVCGNGQIGSSVHVGAGAIVLENRRIGDRAMLAAGAVVIRDVPAGATVKGVPAA